MGQVNVREGRGGQEEEGEKIMKKKLETGVNIPKLAFSPSWLKNYVW